MSSGAASEKVVVVGWDGADWTHIDPMLEDGELPNLRKLIDDGGRSNLSSVRPTMSPVAWTSYSTGSDPSVHGIYDFIQRTDEGFKPMTSLDVRKPFFWNQLGENRTSVVVNVPMTYPPSETKGVLVGGYLSSNDTTYTYPASLSEELNKEGYIIEALSGGFEPGEEKELVRKSNNAARQRTESALRLYREEDPDFFHVTYTGLDRVQHYLGVPSEGGREHYRVLDEELGKIMNATGENTTVILMSDHGFGPLKTEIYLNEWMQREGYLKLKQDKGLLAKLGITQQKIVPLLRRFGLLDIAREAAKIVGFDAKSAVPQPTLDSIALDETKAYVGNYRGSVHIVRENVDNVTEFKQELKGKLEEMEYRDEKVFSDVIDTGEIYSADDSKAPELVVVPRNGMHVVGFLGVGKLYSEDNKKRAVHRYNGILATNSDSITTDNPSITDLAPTILDMMDAEKPDYMTGKSLIE